MSSHHGWLNQQPETIIDPHRPVIDCHHHFYRDRGAYFDYQPDYLSADLAADLNDGHQVVATVAVECGYGYRESGPDALKPLGETEFMLACGASYREHKLGETLVCQGIVPFIDLRLGDGVEDAVLAHRELAGERFKGIRQLAARKLETSGLEKGPGLLLNGEFQKGLRRLQEHNLTFDVWILHPQLPELLALAKKFPATTFILNHCGAPLGVGPYAGHRDAVMKDWHKDMARLAELHNVVVKLGGLYMALGGFDFDKQPAPPSSDELLAASRDYYLRTIDLFTPERCLFESNFPVDKVSVSYRTLWNAFKKIAREFSDDEAEDLLCENARRIYRL